ncbi:unnamed protein product [Alopecurus aequalis]
MGTLQLFCIQLVIAFLLFTQAKSTTHKTSAHPNDTVVTSCIASERSALVTFRAGLSDPANLLSSWKGDDCCRWNGVYCGTRTGHVVRLDLRGDGSKQVLAGKISSSLLGLQHLRYLDLSGNGFQKIQIPEFVGSLHKLRYLDLSMSMFIGRIPPQLGNLSNLRYLNLGTTSFYLSFDYFYNVTYSTDIKWLSQLTCLEHLDMSNVNLSTIVHWLPVVNMLPTLKVLHLFNCQLKISPDSLQLSNLTSLGTLDLSGNGFHKRSTPNWFWDLASLKYLDISLNGFFGPFPDEIGNMTSMVELTLSVNNLVGMIPSNMKNLCNLEKLYCSLNNINGSITELFHRLPSCSQNKLQVLDLLDSNLTGSLPATLVESLSNLSWLDLSENKLTGHVPLWIGELTKLTVLDLSFNKLDGVMHESHFSGLDMLEQLILSDTSIAITFFGTLPVWTGEKLSSLSFLRLRSNMFYGHIPVELTKLVNLQYLDLAYNNISGSIPRSIVNCTGMTQTRHNSHDLLYAFTSGGGFFHNELVDYTENFTVLTKGQERLYTGEIMYMVNLDLSCNRLTGEIPAEISAFVELKSLNLSWNNFNGKIPENIGALIQVESLDLSHNELSDEIPSSLSALSSLSRLNLSYNNLSGKIPSGNQLQTLEDQASIYIGNPGLCGPPLSWKCSSQPEPIPGDNHGDPNENDVVSLFLATGSGSVMGLWVVFCTLLFNRKWRASWYSLCDRLYDRAYVQVVLTWASLRGKING